MIRSIWLLLLVTVFTMPSGMAQEDAAPQPPATTTSDPGIPLDILKLRLEPLRADQLEKEALAWQDLVQKSALTVMEAAIVSRNTADDSDDKQPAIDKLIAARETTGQRIKRFNLVLDQWESVGGDVAAHRKYAVAVGKGGIDVEDSASVAELVRRPLFSSERWQKIGHRLGLVVLVLLCAWLIGQVAGRLVSYVMVRHQASSHLLDSFVRKLVSRGVLVLGLMLGLAEFGVNLSAMVALVGGASFIIGFAMQDTLSNFANGLMVLIYQPFDVGDDVEIGGVSGIVEDVTLVNTRIRTIDSRIVYVPNKSVWGQVITNATTSPNRRIDLVFGIGYEDDLDKAREVLEEIVTGHDLVLADPAPVIRVHELADSSVNFVCRPWAANADYWKVYWDITEQVKREFDANGISIPYPQRDIHLQSAPQITGEPSREERNDVASDSQPDPKTHD